MEIGPYRVKDENTLVLNNGSWNEFANLLFVDNPVGTGFSYVDTDSYLHELTEMANDFVTFLEKFFAIFPEYDQDDVSYKFPTKSLTSACKSFVLTMIHRSTLRASLTLASTSLISPKQSSIATKRSAQIRDGVSPGFSLVMDGFRHMTSRTAT